MEKVAVLGVGMIRFGLYPDTHYGILGRDAGLAALDDAGVSFTDIDAQVVAAPYPRDVCTLIVRVLGHGRSGGKDAAEADFNAMERCCVPDNPELSWQRSRRPLRVRPPGGMRRLRMRSPCPGESERHCRSVVRLRPLSRTI